MPFATITMEELMQLCVKSVYSRRCLLIGVLNAAKIVMIRRNDQLRHSLLQCDLLVADGLAVVWASRILRKPLPERIAGFDLFEQLLHVADRGKLSIYLLGAKPEVLAVLKQRIRTLYPDLLIAGAHDGYFNLKDEHDIVKSIHDSGADMLFLGISSPKKELFLSNYAKQLNVPILHGVGGSFDIMAGVTRRAPIRWQRIGLEWLYRLVQEPRRLGPRYFKTNQAFILLTLKELVLSRLPRIGSVDSRIKDKICLNSRKRASPFASPLTRVTVKLNHRILGEKR